MTPSSKQPWGPASVGELQIYEILARRLMQREFFERFKCMEQVKHLEFQRAVNVRYSVSMGREVDVFAECIDAKGMKVVILIEVKVDATFQPGQPEFYETEKKRQEKQGILVHTMLLAPQKRLDMDSAKLFDSHVSLEEFTALFQGFSVTDHGEYDKNILTYALEKSKRKKVIIDKEATKFFNQYYELAEKLGLHVNRKSENSAGTWPSFRLEGAPSRAQMWQEVLADPSQHCVAIWLSGLGPQLEELRARVQPLLDSELGIELRSAGKTAAFEIKVPAIYPKLPFETQRENVLHCLYKAKLLSQWWRTNRDALLKIMADLKNE